MFFLQPLHTPEILIAEDFELETATVTFGVGKDDTRLITTRIRNFIFAL
jgi:hypothetical protein